MKQIPTPQNSYLERMFSQGQHGESDTTVAKVHQNIYLTESRIWHCCSHSTCFEGVMMLE